MGKRYLAAAILVIVFLPSCICLSNRDYVQQHPELQGIKRIAIFLQRWPVYLQKRAQSNLGEDFIKTKTYFYGAWQPADQINPRAVATMPWFFYLNFSHKKF